MIDQLDYWVLSDRVLRLNGEGTLVEESLALGISGCRIEVIHPAGKLRKSALREEAELRGIEVHDVGRAPVVPSFVNAHSHLAMAPLRGITSQKERYGNVVNDLFFRLEREMTPADVRCFAKMGAFESHLEGVGEVWDHYYFGGEVATALLEVGLSAVVAPTLQDLSGPGSQKWQEQLEATVRIAKSEEYSQAGITAALGPHASDTVSDFLFEKVRQHAVSLNLPVHLHAAQSLEEVEASYPRFSDGMASSLLSRLSGLSVLMAHGLHLSESECRQLILADWVLAYCPLSQLQFGFLSPLSTWVRHGGKWALGSDCVASNDALSVQRELPLVAGNAALETSFSRHRHRLLNEGGVASSRLLESGRKRELVASQLALPQSILPAAQGQSLRHLSGPQPSAMFPGSLANFLVLDPDHPSLFPGDDLPRALVYGSTAGAIRWAVYSGKMRGRSGGLLNELSSSLEYHETLRECRRRRGELFERAQIPLVP